MLAVGGCADLGNSPGLPGEAHLVNKGGSTPYRHAMSSVDASNGWVVGDSGLVERTTDGGLSWSNVPSGTSAHLQCVQFVDVLNGWVAGSTNTIGRTTDGGRSWGWIHPAGDSGRTFIGISMADRHAGWLVGNYSTVLRTNDGGYDLGFPAYGVPMDGDGCLGCEHSGGLDGDNQPGGIPHG